MKDSKMTFSGLQTEDIKEYIRLANEELEKRKEVRKKELWGNVVAAIKKYESEIGDIIFVDLDNGTDLVLCKRDNGPMEILGKIYLV